eukprot:GHVP01011125.1.p1 GENE.GHVP01011125.1~~GHVP01011125.1.p1  ORF type:complete len:135 (+),score=23.19 GHVP01011125.1:183-587(+)
MDVPETAKTLLNVNKLATDVHRIDRQLIRNNVMWDKVRKSRQFIKQDIHPDTQIWYTELTSNLLWREKAREYTKELDKQVPLLTEQKNSLLKNRKILVAKITKSDESVSMSSGIFDMLVKEKEPQEGLKKGFLL